MKYRVIDLDVYPRKSHFLYFQEYANPYVGLTCQVDVTQVKKLTKQKGLPFFLSCLYLAGRAANQVPQLRQRIQGQAIIEYENCHTSHTVALEDGTYCYCELDCMQPYSQFLPYALEKQNAAKKGHGIPLEEDEQALLFVSCVPWKCYTAITQPTPYPADSNPRITFGGYVEQDGRLMMPVTLLANHALVDGVHIAAFFQGLEQQAAIFSGE